MTPVLLVGCAALLYLASVVWPEPTPRHERLTPAIVGRLLAAYVFAMIGVGGIVTIAIEASQAKSTTRPWPIIVTCESATDDDVLTAREQGSDPYLVTIHTHCETADGRPVIVRVID